MWNRRKFLKFALAGLAGTTGGFSILQGCRQKNLRLDIVEYPSPILRGVSEPIDLIDDSIISLTHSMISILRTKALSEFFFKGSLYKGMAAPQVGVQKRLIVCGLYGAIHILINPQIVEKSGFYSNIETCLSLPQYGFRVIKRSQHVRVKYKTVENIEKILFAKNSSAALLEHEIDHLDGVLYIDY